MSKIIPVVSLSPISGPVKNLGLTKSIVLCCKGHCSKKAPLVNEVQAFQEIATCVVRYRDQEYCPLTVHTLYSMRKCSARMSIGWKSVLNTLVDKMHGVVVWGVGKCVQCDMPAIKVSVRHDLCEMLRRDLGGVHYALDPIADIQIQVGSRKYDFRMKTSDVSSKKTTILPPPPRQQHPQPVFSVFQLEPSQVRTPPVLAVPLPMPAIPFNSLDPLDGLATVCTYILSAC